MKHVLEIQEPYLIITSDKLFGMLCISWIYSNCFDRSVKSYNLLMLTLNKTVYHRLRAKEIQQKLI